jgi:adenylosuccinate lyase
MADVWAEQTRYATWVQVEVLASEAQALLGVVPASALADIRHALVPSVERVAELERERDHEVLAFLAAFCAPIPEDSARWVHLGMTSYDLVDTALGYAMARACDLLIAEATGLRDALIDKALEHWETACIGRTHGMHAEPTTFGHKLAGFAFAIERSLRRLSTARQDVAVGTISGAVGTYGLVPPFVEQHVCSALGLGIEPAPSQVVARDRHAALVQAVAILGACVENLATEVRLLSRSEVREVEEARTGAYQGSSAMPHKRNPTASERLTGLARILRGYASMALEDVTLWHERDLAHSSVERVVLPDAFTVAHYQAAAAATLIRGLEVSKARMRTAIDETQGLAYSSAILADLLQSGSERERAYRLIQDAASSGDFIARLQAQGVEVGELEPTRYLSNHDVILKRLELIRELDHRP